jgi:hypothetical protein
MPALLLLIPFGLLVALAAAGKAKANGRVDDQLDDQLVDGGPMPAPTSGGQKRLRCALAVAGLDDAWLRFFEQTAHRESRFSTRAANRSTGEAAAALRVADRWRDLIATAGFPFESWTFGSGGWFGFLPGSALIDGSRKSFRFPLDYVREVGPNGVFQMGTSVASALAYAKGLSRWPNFQGSWASLNVGWGNPSKMGNAASIAESARKLEDRAAKLGWPRGWAMQPISALPSRTPSQYEAVARAAQRAGEVCG